MKSLSVPLDNLSLGLPNIELSRTSLCIKEGANEEDYSRLESWLDTVGGSMLWWWGDYINHLASVRGVDYAEAKAASSYSPGALRTASWVCRHVDVSRRRDSLTYSHHVEVAALSPTDQEIWLGKAENEEWSQKELRAEIRKSKAAVTNGPDQAPEDQRAARASASYEEFATWYRVEQSKFTADQQQEWDRANQWLVDDFIARNSAHVLFRLKELTR